MGGSIEDRGQPNPRQADVDRIRDAAFASAKAQRSKTATRGASEAPRVSGSGETPVGTSDTPPRAD